MAILSTCEVESLVSRRGAPFHEHTKEKIKYSSLRLPGDAGRSRFMLSACVGFGNVALRALRACRVGESECARERVRSARRSKGRRESK
jgi:hypothetical protein